MRDALKAYLSMASGLSEVTRQRALTAAKALVSQGEATAEQVSGLAEDLVSQSRSNREAVTALVKYEVDRTLGRVGLASAEEVGGLTARIRVLESELRQLRTAVSPVAASAAAGPHEVPVDKVPAKQAPAKRVPAKQAPADTARARRKAPAGNGAAPPVSPDA